MRYPRAHGRIAVGFVAVLTAAALAACGTAGGTPDTPNPPPARPTGSPVVLNGITANSADHSVALQNLFIEKPGASGYPAGSSVKLSMDAWNNTGRQVAMTSATATNGATVVFVDGSSPSATPAATFSIPLPPGGFLPLQPKIGRYVEVRCLPKALTAGATLKVTFHFDNGATVVADIPVDTSTAGEAATAPPSAC
jgi:copper(I)-binding protein